MWKEIIKQHDETRVWMKFMEKFLLQIAKFRMRLSHSLKEHNEIGSERRLGNWLSCSYSEYNEVQRSGMSVQTTSMAEGLQFYRSFQKLLTYELGRRESSQINFSNWIIWAMQKNLQILLITDTCQDAHRRGRTTTVSHRPSGLHDQLLLQEIACFAEISLCQHLLSRYICPTDNNTLNFNWIFTDK